MFVETPNEFDRVSGGRVTYHPNDPSVFQIITWMNFSSKKPDRYEASVSTWKIAKYNDPDTGTEKLGVFFIDLSVRYRHETEFNLLKPDTADQNSHFYEYRSAEYFVPDQHKRRARAEGRNREGSQRFNNLIIHKPDGWEKWLVDSEDQVIPRSHTSALAR